jgi:hypothetical protein
VSYGEHHEVIDLSCSPGELSFHARIGGGNQRVSLRTSGGETATGADPVLAACLMPAMALGGTLTLPEPVSPRLLRTQREYQAVQRAWSLDWVFQEVPLEEVEVVAPARPPEPPRKPGRVAAFFSGGVDSWATLLDNREITDLIFVRGIDLLPGSTHHEQLAPMVEARAREVADGLGLELHVVDTNLRELSDPLVQWDAYFACACMAVAHFLAPRFERVLLAGAMDHEVDYPMGAARLIDHLWSTERLEIADGAGRRSRVERTKRIADHPLVRRTLRVCWENPDGAYNCGRCRKCLMTMITLEALGARSDIETFPPDLDLDDIAAIEIKQIVLLTLWEDVLDLVRAEGRADLEPAVEEAVERAKRELGLAPSYRRRHLPGPPPLLGRAPDPIAEERSATALAEVLGSRSWRMTAPLRRAGAAIRRLGRAG